MSEQINSKKLRIGFVVDNETIDIKGFELITAVIENSDYFVEPVIISQKLQLSTKRSFLLRIGRLLWSKGISLVIKVSIIRLIESYELERVRSQQGYENFRRTTGTAGLGLNTISICPSISPSGYVFRYQPDEVRKVRDLKCDVLVRCGSGILKGEILTAVDMGILSFHHADNRKYRGGPVGFWEVLHDEPSTGFVIQRLTEELDGGLILFRGNIPTSRLWLMNEAAILRKSNVFMLRVLQEIARTRKLPIYEPGLPYSHNLYRMPSIWDLVSYLSREYPRIAVGYFREKLGLHLKWSVSFLCDKNLDVPLFRGIKIENPERNFLADPFVINHQERTVCFVEELFFDERKGKISAYELRGNQYKALGVVLEEKFHLSFPFVFEFKGEVFMVPESHEDSTIRLYKCTEFPHRWRLESILMSGVAAVDTVLFKQEDKWFMLTNICSVPMGDFQSELHIFWSDDLFSGRWNPFSNNPVIFDSTKARNGGLFSLAGKTYRVSQVHGRDHYGKSLRINEIVDIGVNRFSERELVEVTPNFYRGLKSTHHLHICDGYVVFDHNSYEKIQ